jgi:hypothetical protein
VETEEAEVNRMWVGLAVVSLLVAGCRADSEVRDVDGVGVADDDEAAGDVPVCLRGERFVADGAIEVRDAAPGDAHRIAAFRWERHEGCERFVIDLEAEGGAPAERAGTVTAELLRDLGVVRVGLRDFRMVDPDASDATFDGPLASAAFAVWSPEGPWVYVDVHLTDAAEARVTTLDQPARVVVDLRPGGPALPEPAPRETRVVVLEPRPGPAAYPLTVRGYARTFEANVVARMEHGGEEVFSDFTTASAWADAWGDFSFTIEEGPSGLVVLHVGEHSARDGTWEGVAVELDMR